MNLNRKIHSPETHVVLYAMLLVFTPFIMLQNYLQRTIGELSDFSIYPFGLRLPLMFSIAVVLFVAFIIAVRKKITLYRTVAVAVVFAMILLSQEICDFYIGNPFYDLQNNWHYIAYAIFAILMYRMLKSRGKNTAFIVRTTYIFALLLSTFDEVFQFFLSSRVFDIGDIAKDGWGVLIGLVIIYFIYEEGRLFRKKKWRITQDRFRDYFRNPLSFMVLAGVFNLLFLFFGSLLTELEYIGEAMLIVFGSFTVVFTVIHLSRIKPIRIAILVVLGLAAISLGFSFIKFHDENIVYNTYGLTVYKGIPIPYFDIMIFPNGTFRLVDKKHYFNSGDKTTIYEQKADIVVIGAGADGKGGGGFGSDISSFAFNPYTKRCIQSIVLPTPNACNVFNRLKKEGKNVLFIIHNTC